MSSAALILHLMLWSFAGAAQSSLPIDFPLNIWVQREARNTVTRLWLGSLTFRAQCAKIAAHPRYRVHITLDPALIAAPRRNRAKCTLKVYSSGVVMARITVPEGIQLRELIPHELEHVLEHIDGVDLKRAARTRNSGTSEVGDGSFETRRAIDAGLRARSEMAGAALATVLVSRR